MTDTLDTDSLLVALQEAMRGGECGVGLTVYELRQKLSKSDGQIRGALRKISDSGKLCVSMKHVTRIDGGWGWVPTYYIKQ
jgi:hypothetical protein